MAKEYIEREEVIKILEQYDLSSGSTLGCHSGAIECAISAIEMLPAADVVEVRQGLWIQPHWKNSNYCCNCSECGGEAMHREYHWDKNGIYPICPNCGAKIDKE